MAESEGWLRKGAWYELLGPVAMAGGDPPLNLYRCRSCGMCFAPLIEGTHVLMRGSCSACGRMTMED